MVVLTPMVAQAAQAEPATLDVGPSLQQLKDLSTARKSDDPISAKLRGYLAEKLEDVGKTTKGFERDFRQLHQLGQRLEQHRELGEGTHFVAGQLITVTPEQVTVQQEDLRWVSVNGGKEVRVEDPDQTVLQRLSMGDNTVVEGERGKLTRFANGALEIQANGETIKIDGNSFSRSTIDASDEGSRTVEEKLTASPEDVRATSVIETRDANDKPILRIEIEMRAA
ncbi:MAG: hypothetical protein KC910_26270 [Candidatus Eremiobacteraeota bacterium]|nr:hypothetical protein [Candidatus Eremiobacteraeota bacterium]